MGQTFSEMSPPKPKWRGKDMTDQRGKVFIVTGGNTGIGRETVRVLLSHNATVYLAARTPSKAQAAISELVALPETGDDAATRLHFLELDLGDLRKVKKSAEEFREREQRLDVLICNAGVMIPPTGSVTADGFEQQWGTNVLGHHLFTVSLLPLLLETAKNAPKGSVRVVNVSSLGHNRSHPGQIIDFKKFEKGAGGTGKGLMGRFGDYGSSKLGNVLITKTLAERYTDQGLTSVSLNPGNINSDLQRHSPTIGAMILRLMLYSVEYGALTQLYCATSGDITQEDSGKYYIPWARLGKVQHPKANDDALAKEVWDWCEAREADVLGTDAKA